MGWRIVQITKPCKLSIKNKQLIYEPLEGDNLSLPLEDISVVIIEHKQVVLNNALISSFADFNIVLFSCDYSHVPSGVFFPFHNHSRYSEMAFFQIEMSEPLKKRLWQEIVKSKINNQAYLLDFFGKEKSKKLFDISKNVQSGDVKNAEAHAAGIYWKNLFEDFKRHKDDDIRNSVLNYGYAIIRGCVARSVVGAGLLPCFGLHHCSKLNSFNLVDDVMEPFRPFVDYAVFKLNLTEAEVLTPVLKSKLLGVLNQNCLIQNEEINLLKAIELSAVSLAKAIKNKQASDLKTPLLIKIPFFE